MAKVALLAGQQRTPEEIKRQFQRKIYFILCIIALLFGVLNCVGAGYISYVTDSCGRLMAIAVVGILLTIVALIGIKASQSEKYDWMYIYIYGVLLIIPIVLVSTVCCFAFHDIVDGYVRHEWELGKSNKLRELFCSDDTAYEQCRAPYDGGMDYNSTSQWCYSGCPYQGKSDQTLLCDLGTTGCEELVTSSQDDASQWLKASLQILGALGIVNLLLLVFGISSALQLITVPIAMKSVIPAINFELVLPVVLSICAGVWSLNHRYTIDIHTCIYYGI
jgi:hypothetical protein